MNEEYKNNDKLYVDTNRLSVLIADLNSKKTTLENILNNQKVLVENIKYYWGGTNGEKAYLLLKERTSKYDLYLSELTKNIKFLNDVKNAYINEDTTISNSVDNE